jgi:hypothetical protein
MSNWLKNGQPVRRSLCMSAMRHRCSDRKRPSLTLVRFADAHSTAGNLRLSQGSYAPTPPLYNSTLCETTTYNHRRRSQPDTTGFTVILKLVQRQGLPAVTWRVEVAMISGLRSQTTCGLLSVFRLCCSTTILFQSILSELNPKPNPVSRAPPNKFHSDVR